ncbi:MAG TPA: permease prefix domain 1-containing protein, partial [Candidatus Solibacter sp.]|nr:permease prefix domain 1-containing protein [Candidatus Solibacter sp.]
MDAELEDELGFHLDQLVSEMVSSGVPPNEARQAALRRMGSIAQFQEECRDMRHVNLWEDCLRDIGYTWRSWTRTPFFYLSVILILAVGIGVNCAVFTVVQAVVLSPLPYPHADQLVALWKTDKKDSAKRSGVAPADFLDLQEQCRTCAAVGAFSNDFFDVTGVEEPYRVMGRRVSPNIFATLGVHPE